ncbi:hypothetical protein [Peribacillus simplex]|uniref:hypothetical protein n=1 Tax=Peribacillus simplex TaxID=1478 RepID=UPI0025A05F22|nr:hypothetical protein [Peribacillus simplex]
MLNRKGGREVTDELVEKVLEGVEELEGPEDIWKVTEVNEEETGEEGIVKKNGIFNTGKGKHTLTVTDTFNVNVQYQ